MGIEHDDVRLDHHARGELHIRRGGEHAAEARQLDVDAQMHGEM